MTMNTLSKDISRLTAALDAVDIARHHLNELATNGGDRITRRVAREELEGINDSRTLLRMEAERQRLAALQEAAPAFVNGPNYD